MPDDFADYDYESEPAGNKGLRAVHKAGHAFRKACEKALTGVEHPDAHAHISEHLNGITKALKAMTQLHGKAYKGTPPLPEDYPEEEPPMQTKDINVLDEEHDGGGEHDAFDDDQFGKSVDGGMSYQDDTSGGAVGVRPEDEEEADAMSDEEYDHLRKSLPALERRLGLMQ